MFLVLFNQKQCLSAYISPGPIWLIVMREYFPVSILYKFIAGPLSARQGSWRADNGPL